jgi:tetratricopeptide (TPR) repeat protein
LFLCAAGQCALGQFGFTKLNVPMTIVRPPDFALRGRTFEVTAAKGVAFPDHQGLKLAFERALSSTYTPTAEKPEMRITYAISNYQPVNTRTYTVSETKYIKVGEETYTDKNGKQKTRDKYDNRNVPVEYWESSGAVTMTVQTFDAAGVMLDTFSITQNCQSKRTIAENGASKLGAGDSLPGQPALLAGLMQFAARDLQVRYTKTKRAENVMLAKNDPLKAGNESAKQGDWKAALAHWSDAAMKKDQEFQYFNMAVANEALAYAVYDKTEDPKEAEPHFVEALRLYGEAKRMNTKEKYFERASSRIEEFRANMERSVRIQEAIARDIEAAKQRAVQEAAEAAQKEREAKDRLVALEDSRPDSAMEKEFRADVRARMRSMEQVKPEDEEKWRGDGKIFKLEPLQIDRVIFQEAKRHTAVVEGSSKYKAIFAEFVADKRITAEERERLKVRQKLLELPDDEVASIEAAAGPFTDDTVKRAPVAAVKPAGAAAPKPAQAPKQSLLPAPKKQ